MRLALITLSLLLAGCAADSSFNDAMTPSARVDKDSFDGKIVIRQDPVSAASSLTEAWHSLGFDWTERTPDTVYVTAAVQGIAAITGLAFNIDGRVVDELQTASAATDFEGITGARISSRRFAMPYSDFNALAQASSVKMRINFINNYTVSSFGRGQRALVNAKLDPFLAEVDRWRQKLGQR